jgi:hypothetical protein
VYKWPKQNSLMAPIAVQREFSIEKKAQWEWVNHVVIL